MFSVFAWLMRTSGANDLISGEGSFTVFAPTNDAFNKIPDQLMNGWLSETSQERLKNVLSYHIVPTKIMAGEPRQYSNSRLGLRRADEVHRSQRAQGQPKRNSGPQHDGDQWRRSRT